MKIITLVVVYQRWHNAERWQRVWDATARAEQLVIVHNVDQPGTPAVWAKNTIAIERPNVGMDIGVLQDVVRGRLPIGEWDWLFFAPDDFLPMSIDFLEPFRRLANSGNVALVGSRLSSGPGIAEHCRTGAFMIRRDVAEQLQFPADPITDCHQCGRFEFKSHNMLQQVRDLGHDVAFLDPIDKRVIWDSHHEGWEQRLGEFPCRDLCDIFQQYETDKFTLHSYGPVYQELLHDRRACPAPVLEIGVQRGFSLRSWRDYFHTADIHGVDINSDWMLPAEPRLQTHLCDVQNFARLSQIAREHGPFQLIIDDGSHLLSDILAAHAVLRSCLTPDGIYVIEDVSSTEMLDLFRAWPNADCRDLRAIKGRSDDMMVIIRNG